MKVQHDQADQLRVNQFNRLEMQNHYSGLNQVIQQLTTGALNVSSADAKIAETANRQSSNGGGGSCSGLTGGEGRRIGGYGPLQYDDVDGVQVTLCRGNDLFGIFSIAWQIERLITYYREIGGNGLLCSE